MHVAVSMGELVHVQPEPARIEYTRRNLQPLKPKDEQQNRRFARTPQKRTSDEQQNGGAYKSTLFGKIGASNSSPMEIGKTAGGSFLAAVLCKEPN